MADFRQNSPEVQSQNSIQNFSTDSTNPYATSLTGITTAFSAFADGADKAAQRQYRERSAQLAELSNQRAAAAEERNIFEFDRARQQDAVNDVVAGNVVSTTMGALRQTLISTGYDPGILTRESYTPEEAKAIERAVQNANSILGISSGHSRGSQMARVRLLMEMEKDTEENPSLRAEFLGAYQQNTGHTFYNQALEASEVAQFAEINRAKEVQEQLKTYRQTYALPPNMADEDVLTFASQQARFEENMKRVTARGNLANANAAVLREQGMRTLADNADKIYAIGAAQSGRLMQRIDELKAQNGGVLSAEQITAITTEVYQGIGGIRSQLVGAFVDPQDASSSTAFLDDMAKNVINYANGTTDATSFRNYVSATQDLSMWTALNSAGPDGRRVVDSVTRMGVLESLAGKKPSSAVEMTLGNIGASNVRHGIEAFGRVAVGKPLLGVGQGVGNLGPNPAAAIGGANIFAQFTLGNVRPENEPRPTANPTLTGTRSLANIPGVFKPNTRIDGTLNDRLDAANQAIAAIAADPKATDARIIRTFIEQAATLGGAGTYHIDPALLDKIKPLTYEYLRTMTDAMRKDWVNISGNRSTFTNVTSALGSAMANDNPFMGAGMPSVPADFQAFRLGNGIQAVENEAGGVTFRVASYVTDPAKRAEAARTVTLFNTKYAPQINMLTRAYAHIMQGNTNYRTALPAVMLGGAAGGAQDYNDIMDQAKAQLLLEFPGMSPGELDTTLSDLVRNPF